jgi:hypothetical protein
MDDDAFEREIENSPVFIASQLRPGHVLTEGDVKAIGALLSDLDSKENAEIDLFHEGRIAGFREIGGEDLVTSVQLKDDERIAHHVRKTMDRLFPKEHRRPQ